jgi:hypothetical protein
MIQNLPIFMLLCHFYTNINKKDKKSPQKPANFAVFPLGTVFANI